LIGVRLWKIVKKMGQKRNKVDIYLHDQKAGLLERTDGGYRFTYYDDYFYSDGAEPVSITLPLREKTYESASLFPFFLGLIPEGWLLDITSRTLKIDPENVFAILVETCGDCIGAVKIVPLSNGDNT